MRNNLSCQGYKYVDGKSEHIMNKLRVRVQTGELVLSLSSDFVLHPL